jgi:hypothetical protein
MCLENSLPAKMFLSEADLLATGLFPSLDAIKSAAVNRGLPLLRIAHCKYSVERSALIAWIQGASFKRPPKTSACISAEEEGEAECAPSTSEDRTEAKAAVAEPQQQEACHASWANQYR